MSNSAHYRRADVDQGKYRKWLALPENKDFQSKLPNDVKMRRDAMAKEREKQTQIDAHLKEMPKKERVIQYTQQVFRRAAIEWLIATGQVCHIRFPRNIFYVSEKRYRHSIIHRTGINLKYKSSEISNLQLLMLTTVCQGFC